MLGLESALSIINQTMVVSGLMNWESVADRMSYAPAKIARYGEHGKALTVGSIANITLINPGQTYRVDRDLVASRSRNTPFHGMDLQGAVTATFFKGFPTFLKGKLTSVHDGIAESAGR
jgi:dihydroorotase